MRRDAVVMVLAMVGAGVLLAPAVAIVDAMCALDGLPPPAPLRGTGPTLAEAVGYLLPTERLDAGWACETAGDTLAVGGPMSTLIPRLPVSTLHVAEVAHATPLSGTDVDAHEAEASGEMATPSLRRLVPAETVIIAIPSSITGVDRVSTCPTPTEIPDGVSPESLLLHASREADLARESPVAAELGGKILFTEAARSGLAPLTDVQRRRRLIHDVSLRTGAPPSDEGAPALPETYLRSFTPLLDEVTLIPEVGLARLCMSLVAL